ncbi:hypothetical protein BZL29_7683 [Mycobacterium kansasii]|uniref:Uncharacterized protein n=1 Tax=Mycobacterium kansasii TaxID=1768 RepID=A0A1V3WGQ2_MYCKA|nr:hypothetical protein BZL29_7683 [Mycobacterium kansasii]
MINATFLRATSGSRRDPWSRHLCSEHAQGCRIAEFSCAVAVLTVPSDREARCRVEVALLLVEYQVEDFVDSASAERTVIFEPSGSRTPAYRLNTAIPGPIAAWGRSTGAIMPCSSLRSAAGSSDSSEAMKPRRSVVGEPSGGGRRDKTMEEARALVQS